MKKILDFIAGVLSQSDKRKHLFAGFAISFIIGVFSPWRGVIAAILVGAAKEWWDSKGNGTPELLDFLCTVAGAILALPVSLLIHNLIW
jgi:hypothetical protein